MIDLELEKEIYKMTEDEILRQQLELLAERAKKCKSVKGLSRITDAMVNLRQAIKFINNRH